MSIFITGIGTDVGKTYISCQLIAYAKSKGINLKAYKPVVSGFDDLDEESWKDSDPVKLLESQDRQLKSYILDDVHNISPWRFKAPRSPDVAASLEGKPVDFEELIYFCNKKINQNVDVGLNNDSNVLIEGVGGLLVPINAKFMVIDWIKALDIPCILVGGTYLGAVNHTLMSLKILKSYDIEIKMLIVNESDTNSVGIEQTLLSLKPFLEDVLIGSQKRGETNASWLKDAEKIFNSP